MSNYFPGSMPDRYWVKTYFYWPAGLTLAGDIINIILFICQVPKMVLRIAQAPEITLYINQVESVELER
jgi:hypothetical protein